MNPTKISKLDSSVKFLDFENFFEVYEDSRDQRRPYTFNLNSTLYLDGVPKNTKKITHDMFWTTISYDIYETTRLWWLLMKVNNVTADKMFDVVPAGTDVRFLNKETVKEIA